jgi:hypothetical protein
VRPRVHLAGATIPRLRGHASWPAQVKFLLQIFFFFAYHLYFSDLKFNIKKCSHLEIEVIAPGIQNLVRDVQNHTKTFKWWCNGTKRFPNVQISYKSNHELTRVHSSRRQRVCKLALRRTEFFGRKHRGGGQEILQRSPSSRILSVLSVSGKASLSGDGGSEAVGSDGGLIRRRR